MKINFLPCKKRARFSNLQSEHESHEEQYSLLSPQEQLNKTGYDKTTVIGYKWTERKINCFVMILRSQRFFDVENLEVARLPSYFEVATFLTGSRAHRSNTISNTISKLRCIIMLVVLLECI